MQSEEPRRDDGRFAALIARLAGSSELQQRAISGGVIAVVALALLYWSAPAFAVLTAAVAAVMSWEWSRLVRGEADTPALVHIAAVVIAGLLTLFGIAGLGVAAACVGAIAVGALLVGSGKAQLSSLGVLYTGLPVVALGWLRGDEALGFLATLFLILAVAASDIGAFAAGRLLGGPKLWPAVSPNKTWAGLAGGLASAAFVGLLFPSITGSGTIKWLPLLGLILGLIAQAGDLLESALKRQFGVKDAGHILPGHGGFMDRMDGLVTASVAAAIIAFAIDAYAPARALLYGS